MYVTRNQKRIEIEPIYNFYEDLVMDALAESSAAQGMSDEEFSDIACIALNNLPAKYIRHEVDMLFFITPQETEEMRESARRAVLKATRVVRLNMR